MPEYWLRYGRVEVPIEIDEEVAVERITVEARPRQDLSVVAKAAEEAASEKTLTIIYDHSSVDDLELLKAFLAELSARGRDIDRVRIVASSWRICRSVLEEELKSALRPYGRIMTHPWSEGVVEAHGYAVPKSVSEADVRVVVTSILPHGVLGYPSLRDTLALSGLAVFRDDPEDCWIRLKEELKLLGLVVGGGAVYFGELGDIEGECVGSAEKTYTVRVGEEAEIVVVDARGWPWDSTLESSIHHVCLVSRAVVEGGLVGLVSECRGGIGSPEFGKALFTRNTGGEGLVSRLIKNVRDLLGRRRLAMVSTVPRSVLDVALGAKGFDSPQDLLTYGFRIFSKQARVKIVGGEAMLVK